ncbi:MAG TPA: ATP synthase F1 subunit epsilon [Bacteroidales bacterium]|nr:ATP synthase F1 subunit epsilon [Bacteroidales bacterium]
MKLEIITPEKRLFDGKVKLVQVPGAKGSFEILKNHAPVISTLNQGKIKVISENDKTEFFDIVSGIVEVKSNLITILAVTG